MTHPWFEVGVTVVAATFGYILGFRMGWDERGRRGRWR